MGIRSTQVGLRWFQALGKPPQIKRQINGATIARINSNADILRECPENRAAQATAPSTLIFSLAAKRFLTADCQQRARNSIDAPRQAVIDPPETRRERPTWSVIVAGNLGGGGRVVPRCWQIK
jgi:hypothetical protein